MSVIDRASPVPYYEQLYNDLLDQIRRGQLGIGERLPGESELHRQYGLSRATVRQALELLEWNGWAQKVARRGFFVTSPDNARGWLIEGPGGFLERGIGHANPRVSTTVVSGELTELPESATSALRIAPGSRGFILKRVRSVDDQVALVSINFSPPEVAPIVARAEGVLHGTSSLTEVLRDAGYTAGGAHRFIHAKAAPTEVADSLHVAPGSPLILIQSTSWVASGLRYDYYETWLRTDVVPLEVYATAHRGGGA